MGAVWVHRVGGGLGPVRAVDVGEAATGGGFAAPRLNNQQQEQQ
jgi:hypothetical protein